MITIPGCYSVHSEEQLERHMMTSLSVAAERFIGAGLLHLAEKCLFVILESLRDKGRVSDMAEYYGRLQVRILSAR
jgi:hypothetical protein